MSWNERARALAGLAAMVCGGAVQAAGGHHAVDDAAILEPGACEIEGWFSRARGGERAVHAGAGCRVGAVEVGVAAEYTRQGGTSGTAYELQAKWAMEVKEGLSLGISVTPIFGAHARPRYQGTVVSGLVTWSARDDLAVHVNLGRDLLKDAPDQNRSGAGLEWTVREGTSLVFERYAEDRTQFARAGVRWGFAPGWSVDMSRAQRLRGAGESNWTFGVTRSL